MKSTIRETSSPFSPRRLLLVVVLLLVSVMLTACLQCPRGAGSRPASPDLSINTLSVNKSTARIGDNIVVRWDYANPTRLRSQSFKVLSLTINGISTSSQNALPNNQREISFPFGGAVTVVITAVDRAGKATDAAFDIALDSQYHFVMKGVGATNPGYPRIGQPRGRAAAIDINFSHFFGIYEVSDSNGVEDGAIDALAGLGNAMPVSESFFGHSFSVEESAKFRFRTGSAFPLLEPGYLLTAEGGQFFGVKTQADAVVFAGKIVYDGTPAKDKKTGLAFRKNVAIYEPLFAAIDIRTDSQGVPHVTDIDLGNTNQGLTVSVFHGETQFRQLGTYSVNYTVSQLGAIGEIQGNIKSPLLGFGVTRSNGAILTSVVGGVEVPGAYVNVNTIDWKVPFHPDTDLSGLQ